jgi:integrase
MKKTRNKRTNTPGLFRTPKTQIFPEGGWEVRYKDSAGDRRRKTFRIKKDALDFKADVRKKKRDGTLLDPRLAQTSLKVVAEHWYEGTANLRPTTRAAYRSMLNNYIIPRLGKYAVGKVTPSVIRSFMAGLPAELSGTRKRHIFRVLSPIMSLAVEDKMIPSNPCRERGVRRMVPKPQRQEMLVLTADEVATLANTITPNYRPLVLFAAYTGMRAGEIVALRRKNLDLMRGQVTVAETVTDVNGTLHSGPPKNSKVRAIALPRFLVDELTEQVAGQKGDDYVFPGANGKPMRHANFYSRHFKPALLKAGLPDIRFHDLRHTCASILIANGEHPKAISDRLGHSSIMLTMDRYGHLFPDHAEAVMDRLQATFDGANGKKDAKVVQLA